MTQPLNHSDLPPCFHDKKILLCELGGGFLVTSSLQKEVTGSTSALISQVTVPSTVHSFLVFFLMKETLFSTCHTKGASFSNSQTNLLMSKENQLRWFGLAKNAVSLLSAQVF